MKKKFAVFDIDGTYFRSHLYWEVVLELARNKKLHAKLNESALKLYSNWKDRTSNLAFEEFDKQTIAVIDTLITELDPAAYDEYVERVIRPKLDHVYYFTKQLHSKLKNDGYFTIALSGSRREEVDLFARHHGFDDWIGQDYYRDERTGRYTGDGFKTHKDKDKILQTFIDKHGLTLNDSYAIGDTGGDIGMLEMVENPIAFDPNRDLLAHAKKAGWKIVIERKSIAFTLEPNTDGEYFLR